MLKRLFDFVVALSALLALFPIFLLLAVWIKLDSPGTIFFVQQRVGLNRSTFNMIKFRSMFVDKASHGQIDGDGDLEKARANYQTTQKNDARITRSGDFIRKFHLDELPQLINVLKGDMSLVGPRPDVPAQEIDYTASQWRRRHEVKPGVTGLSQLYTSHPKYNHNLRIALDIFYRKKASLLFDISIVFKTAVHVVKGKSF